MGTLSDDDLFAGTSAKPAPAASAQPDQFSGVSDKDLLSSFFAYDEGPMKTAIFRSLQARGIRPGAPPVGAAKMDGTGTFGENVAAGIGATGNALGMGVGEILARGGPLGIAVSAVNRKLGIPTLEDQPYIGAPARYFENARRQQAVTDAALDRSGGGITGEVAANIAPFLLTGGAAGLAKAGAAPTTLARVLAPTALKDAALQGAVLSGARPTDSVSQTLANIRAGALGGLGGATLGKALTAVGPRLVGAVTSRLTDQGARTAAARYLADRGVTAPVTIATNSLPVQMTSAEASGSVPLAILTRARRAMPLDQTGGFAQQLSDQVARNRGVVDDALTAAAGTPDDLAAARLARRSATQSLYDQAARTTGFDMSRPLANAKRMVDMLINRPQSQANAQQVVSMLQRRLPDAQVLASAAAPLSAALKSRMSSANFDALSAALRAIRARGQDPATALADIGNLSVDRNIPSAALADARAQLAATVRPEDRGRALMGLRDTMGQMISGRTVGAPVSSVVGDMYMRPVLNSLNRAMAKQSPAYADAMGKYAQMSPDINRMQVLQELVGNGGTARDAMGNITLGKLESAVERPPRMSQALVKAATGRKNTTLAQLLTPEQNDTLANAIRYLRANRDMETLGGGINSQTAQNTANGALSLARRLMPGNVGMLLDLGKAFGDVGRTRFNAALNDALLDPTKLNAMLAMLPSSKQQTARALIASIAPRVGMAMGARSQANGGQ